MADIRFKESPFSPGKPVSVEYFVARIKEIKRAERAIKQASSGRNENLFITGERGIGKSSLAGFIRYLAEKKYNFIDNNDARKGIFQAAEVVGRKYLDPQVYNALRSESYRFMLRKIGRIELGTSFQRKEVLQKIPKKERKTFDNFLLRIKKLGVINETEIRGEYRFTNQLYHLYIWLEAFRVEKEKKN